MRYAVSFKRLLQKISLKVQFSPGFTEGQLRKH